MLDGIKIEIVDLPESDKASCSIWTLSRISTWDPNNLTPAQGWAVSLLLHLKSLGAIQGPESQSIMDFLDSIPEDILLCIKEGENKDNDNYHSPHMS